LTKLKDKLNKSNHTYDELLNKYKTEQSNLIKSTEKIRNLEEINISYQNKLKKFKEDIFNYENK